MCRFYGHSDAVSRLAPCRFQGSRECVRVGITGLDVLQELRSIKTRVTALKSSGAEHLTKTDALESHERKLLEDNRRIKHQSVTDRVEKECHEALDLESPKAISDEKVELGSAKKALFALEGQSWADWSALLSAMKELDCTKGELATTSAKLQVAKGALLLRLTTLSSIPVTCRSSRVQRRNV